MQNEKESKTIDIRITAKDFKKFKPRGDRKRALFSASERVIDELAYSAKQWTEEDLHENNFDYESESVGYLLKEWKGSNAEDEFITLLNKGKLKTVLEFADTTDKQPKNLLPLWKQSKLLFGAFIALEYPALFTEMLGCYQHTVDEAFWDDEKLAEYAPELAKDKQDGMDEFWKNLNHEWLYGDRSTQGVIYEIKKYYGAEETEYQEKHDEFIFTFDENELHEKYCGCGEGYDDIKKCAYKKVDWKAELLSSIESNSYSIYNKKHAESEKHAIERKRLNDYKAEQAKQAEAERIAKLKAMKLRNRTSK